MEGKLIKVEERKYTLVYKEGNIAWEHDPAFDGKLSLKNCQAIENGYDLDELAVLSTKEETTIVGNQKMAQGFIKGFQKALEILGDNKFSEDDMVKFAMSMISQYQFGNTNIHNRELLKESLPQQTEWDVSVVTELAYTVNENSETEMMPEPHIKLDADGCLILKRK